MRFAYVISNEKGAVNHGLSQLATRLIDAGKNVVGTTQVDTPRSNTHKCDMDVHVLPDGEIIRISQDLGPNSRGCHLDADALEFAVAATQNLLPQADILIVNKFGKHEAEGRGFRDVIADALMRDIPVIVGTNAHNLNAFLEFCDGQAEAVDADLSALLAWEAALNPRSS